MADCPLCGERIELGDRVVRFDVLEIIEDPGGSEYWGSPIGHNLRPREETAKRQYAHIACIRNDQ